MNPDLLLILQIIIFLWLIELAGYAAHRLTFGKKYEKVIHRENRKLLRSRILTIPLLVVLGYTLSKLL